MAGALVGPDLSPAERWAARDRLVRIEQLAAACTAHGGRARTQDDPILAHLVIPHAGPQEDDKVVSVAVHTGHRNSWSTDPRAPMTVTSYRGTSSQQNNLDTIMSNYATTKGINDQAKAQSDNATAQGDAFDKAKNDDPRDDDGFARLLATGHGRWASAPVAR